MTLAPPSPRLSAMAAAGLNRGRLLSLAVAGALAVAAVTLSSMDPYTLPDVVIYCVVGVFLIDRRPRNPIGWLVVGLGLGFIGTSLRTDLDYAALDAGTATWPEFLLVWGSSFAGSASFVCYAALAFVFPSGTLPSGRWGVVARVLLIVATAVALIPAVAPSFTVSVAGSDEIWISNRLSPLGGDASLIPSPVAMATVTLIPLLAIAVGVVDLVRRYRTSDNVTRLQIRWLMASVALVLVSILFGLVVWAGIGGQAKAVAWLPAVIAYPTVGLAIGFAVTRYHLYDIDRIISRTFGYAVLTAILGATFVGMVVGISALFGSVTDADTIAVASATLAVFALFQPVRRAVQGSVDRRFDRARYDAQRTADAFAERLRNEVDIGVLVHALAGTAGHAVRPSDVDVWLRRSGGGASAPDAPLLR
jgi:hypothetical protein